MTKPLLAILLLLPLVSPTAVAHSGGLDSNGCHAGSQPYHCHRLPSDMVGNRLRCDLGSRSSECVAGEPLVQRKIQTLDEETTGQRAKPKASIDDAEKLFHRLAWQIDETDILKDAKIFQKEKANLVRIRCVGNATSTTEFSNGDQGLSEEEVTRVFYIGEELFFAGEVELILLARWQDHSWVNQYPDLVRLVISDDQISLTTYFPVDPLGGLNISEYVGALDGTVTVAHWNFDFILDRRSGELIGNDRKYYETENWWVNGQQLPNFSIRTRTIASCQVSPDTPKF